MRRLNQTPALLLAAAALALAGCPLVPPDPPGPSATPGFNADAEASALAQALAGQNMQGYFDPSKLVNDGVGIFASEGGSDPDLPRRWGRSYPQSVQAVTSPVDQMELAFRSNANGSLTAEATYSVTRSARFVADYAWQRKLVTKSYSETATRFAHFEKSDGTWHLLSLSPMVLTSKDLQTRVASARLRWSGGDLTVSPTGLVGNSQAPVAIALASATLEVTASTVASSAEAEPILFLSFPPRRDRIRLVDDGSGADAQAGDHVYSAAFAFPAAMGPANLVVEALSGTTFSDLTEGTYDGAIWGISCLIQGGAAK